MVRRGLMARCIMDRRASNGLVRAREHAGKGDAMARVVAISNLKGGVGKSTTTYALGAALADRGQQVLLVDLDPQASLTSAAGLSASRLRATIFNALLHYNQERKPLALEAYRHALSERLDLLPANLELAEADEVLQAAPRREYLLDKTLLPAHEHYDLILIDCPPSLSLLTTNALTAAQHVVIPVTPEYLAAQGLGLLFKRIRLIQTADLNPVLTVAGAVLTMTDYRTTHNREVANHIRVYLNEQGVSVLGEVKRSVKVSEASASGQSVTHYLAGTDIAEAYEQVAERLLEMWRVRAMSRQAALGS